LLYGIFEQGDGRRRKDCPISVMDWTDRNEVLPIRLAGVPPRQNSVSRKGVMPALIVRDEDPMFPPRDQIKRGITNDPADVLFGGRLQGNPFACLVRID
jgi:hypothetical protein